MLIVAPPPGPGLAKEMPRGPTKEKLSSEEGIPALAARLVDLAPQLTMLQGEAFLDRILQEFSAWSGQVAPGVSPPEVAARVRRLPMARGGALAGALERVLRGADGNLAAADFDRLLGAGPEGRSSDSSPIDLFLDESSEATAPSE